MSGRFKARNQVAIAGFAHSQVVRRADRPLGVTAIETARRAIEDAGLTVGQIDGFVSSPLLPTTGAHEIEDGVSTVTSGWLAKHLGADPAYVVGFQGIGQITGSMSLAVNAIASGAADYVLFHRALHNPAGTYNDNPMTEVRGGNQWMAPQGFFGAMPAIALAYNEYCQRYRASREAMATLVSEARKNGSRIPWSAWYGKPLSVEEYMAEPQIFDPLCRFDADMPVEGVAVFILTSAERARDLPNKPVYVAGYASGYPREHRAALHWTLDEMMDGGYALAKRLWENTGFSPSQIDLPQLYDGFSPFVYIWLESLGFCGAGEAHQLILSGGIDSDKPGALPVMSGGGAIGNGRMHGVPQMLECYLQLSGRAGDRQRTGVTTGLACHSTPHFGGVVAYTNAVD
jgi:acetyl-CoA acetyltransferase